METLEHGTPREGRLATALERRAAKVPSDVFLWLGAGSILGSLAFFATARRQESIFVGMWAPTFLLLGIYNKLVKQAGQDRYAPEVH